MSSENFSFLRAVFGFNRSSRSDNVHVHVTARDNQEDTMQCHDKNFLFSVSFLALIGAKGVIESVRLSSSIWPCSLWLNFTQLHFDLRHS